MASILVVPHQSQLLLKRQRLKSNCNIAKTTPAYYSVIRNERTSSFSCRNTVNLPINELPWASFDQYMDEKDRVVKAVFPEKGTTKQLNKEEWRIKMPAIQCLFLNVQPTADVKLAFKSKGEDYPPHIPHHITNILELHFIRWELQGLNNYYMNPYHFSLDVKGAIYPERRGKQSWLKNQMEMKISFSVSPAMIFVPEHVLKDAVEMVFQTIWNETKQEFHGRLLADYNSFKRYKSMNNNLV